ncbi:replication-associated recombination protein A [bacterium]|nr:replication-associated recombination protein A [bacterium]MBU3955981.1 replication-associated recombination protein A [bacterium]
MKTKKDEIQPLSWRLVPDSFDGFRGQEHLFSPGAPLREMINKGSFMSSLLWGPPGTGKTAFSRFISDKLKYKLVFINAVTSDIAKIRDILKVADFEKAKVETLLVVDEIEHFSRSQQNVFLPCTEKGDIKLVGISFENPYYRMNTALLSRLKVFEFKALSVKDTELILENALKSKDGYAGKIKISAEASDMLIREAGGDARKLLNLLEMMVLSAKGKTVTEEAARKAFSGGLKYDKNDHYEMISAFIKSVRGSSPDAALYWMACMLKGGEDPRFIARRLMILASEDIGNADPGALGLAVSAMTAVESVGMPEARIILAQAVIYCSMTHKSNACYEAISAAEKIAEEARPEVPRHLTRAGAADYLYPHNYGGWADQEYSGIKKKIYKSRKKGFEKELDRIHEDVRKRAA